MKKLILKTAYFKQSDAKNDSVLKEFKNLNVHIERFFLS